MTEHFEGGDIKTAGKLLILQKYLPAYLTIMEDNWNYGEIWYVDTHAGSGKTVVEDGIELDGSPIVALQQDDPGFDRHYLFEKDGSHFRSIVDTLETEFNLDFTVESTDIADYDFLVAETRNPYIKAYQIDSNLGVQLLAQEEADSNHHWFSFLDPGGLELNMDTVDQLIERGHMDILINFQTTGVKRSAAAAHAVESAKSTMGRDDLNNGKKSLDELTDLYCERLQEGRPEWNVSSKEMVNYYDKRYRFDMVFSATVDVAIGIIEDIWSKDSFWEESRKLIEENREAESQSSLGDF